MGKKKGKGKGKDQAAGGDGKQQPGPSASSSQEPQQTPKSSGDQPGGGGDAARQGPPQGGRGRQQQQQGQQQPSQGSPQQGRGQQQPQREPQPRQGPPQERREQPQQQQQQQRPQAPQQQAWGPQTQQHKPSASEAPLQQHSSAQEQRRPQAQAAPGTGPQQQRGSGAPQQRQIWSLPGQQEWRDPQKQQRARPGPSPQLQQQQAQQVQSAPKQAPTQEPQKQQRPQGGKPKQQPQQGQIKQEPSPRQQSQEGKSSVAELPPLGGAGDCLSKQSKIIPGKSGRVIKIESNHLALNLGKLMVAYHYDVAITPDTPKSLLRDVMNMFGAKHYPNRHPAYDGRKNLYSPVKLPFGPSDSKGDTLQVEGENRPREFRVEVKLARTVDLSPLHDMLKTRGSPQDAIQCIDIVLRNAPSNRCISAGRSFFTKPTGQIIELGDGMELYYGFYQSAIRGWKPLLNVDVAHKAFPQVLEIPALICQLGSDFRNTMTLDSLSRPIASYLLGTLEKFLRMLKVKYEIPGHSGSKRIYRVNGLGDPPSKAQFTLENGTKTTVANYFRDVKRVALKYPELPTLWVGARERSSKILLPAELCTIVEGQAVNRKMTENQTSSMIKKSATSTDVRKTKIMNSLRTANFNADPCVREFGFSVNNQFESLDARVLQPPRLIYKGNNEVRPAKGVWRQDRGQFLVGATVKKWTIAFATRYPPRADNLAREIQQISGPNGISMGPPTQPFQHIQAPQNLAKIIAFFKDNSDFDLIFVVVPNSGPQYSFVKQAAELNVGCLTQCIKERTVGRVNSQVVANILLKVNSKLNGTNHAFASVSRPPILMRPCMIMGADVTHPGPDAKDIPSVVAVTASHDPGAFQYNICWRLQPPKVEIIEDLCNITLEQLHFFHQKTKHKPETIIFFRDGVSEGQFPQVQRAEITAIRRACKIIQADGYEPKITFLVVQKRHHTRLFPTNPRDSEDRNNNVPAGTCVDTLITNPNMQDFYLVSHASIQGVAKPTKYCTLWDDNDMSNDAVEQLAYHLCHMFTRCNRSVSYPAPTYYAHLAAARAKVYIENDKLRMDQLQRHQENYKIKECIVKDKPMFFV